MDKQQHDNQTSGCISDLFLKGKIRDFYESSSALRRERYCFTSSSHSTTPPQGQCRCEEALLATAVARAGAHSSGRWHHPLCPSLCLWTEPGQGVAATSAGHSELHHWAASPAAHPLPVSLGRPGKTRH